MNDLAFSQVFPNGSQTVNTWTIAKSDLPGLVASNSNSPGELFTAICLAFLNVNQAILCTDNQQEITTDGNDQIYGDSMDTYTDIQTIYWQLSIDNRNGFFYKNDQLVVFNYEAFTSPSY